MSVTLRTPQDEQYYLDQIKKGLTIPLSQEPAIFTFKFWRLIENKYPYTLTFKTHHMLLPNREFATLKQATKEELDDYDHILDALSADYDCMIVNFPSKQSVKNHYHIHLLVYKDQ